jgi:hypothetical protein
VSRRWSRCAITLCMAWLFLAIAFPRIAYAAAPSKVAVSSQDSVTGVMLANGDLPPGFQPYAPLTGPLNAKRGQLLGIDASDISKLDSLAQGWVRSWVSARTGEVVYELAFDIGTLENAQAQVEGFDSTVLKAGAVKEPFAGSMHFVGFRKNGLIHDVPYQNLSIPLARGPYFFALDVLVPARSSASGSQLIGNLAAAQWRKVPSGTPDTGTSGPDIANATGYVVGAVLAYLGMVNLVAYFRDPLRKARRLRGSQRPTRSEELDVGDVSKNAHYNKGIAILRFVVQLTGACIMVAGADVFVVNYWYLYLIVGAAIVWAAGRFIRPGGWVRKKNLAILAGSHRLLVAFLLSVASVMVLSGLILIIGTALSNSQFQGTANGSQGDAQSFLIPGLILVALGAITHRFARRLGSAEAHRLMLRDTRAPVLYLRSFGDDRLKLWTATLGRVSFIERFSPRRFDAFEEVLVRYLSLRGPVIAVNPPGSGLPPLGAARTTLDPADWHSTVATWMEQSTQIVFVAPPEQVSHGLLWELKAVSASKYWDKTLIIVPPVSPQDLGRRWQAFRYACRTLWPFTFPLPAEVTGVLVLAFRSNKWTMIVADRKSEWSYGAALKEMLEDPPLAVHAPAPS